MLCFVSEYVLEAIKRAVEAVWGCAIYLLMMAAWKLARCWPSIIRTRVR